MRASPVTLQGTHVTLVPLALEHAEPLAEIVLADPRTFAFYSPAYSPPSLDVAGLRTYIAARLAEPRMLPFAVRDHASGRIVGSSTYLDIREQDRGLEIGATFYHPDFRGTRTNPESKLLLLSHAFDALECERVQLKCDARNARSRAAILKLGAQFEGVLRRITALGGGAYRDTAMYSIIREEWPGVRDTLMERLR
jgi:RimJ/RimL family protein N-acetyltransferase